VGSDYERLLSALPKETAPLYLCEQVVDRIRNERIQRTRARLVAASLCTAGSALAGLYVGGVGIATASQTGFFAYLALAFSDSGVVLHDIGSFGLSLLESFPTFETIAFLALCAVLIGSLRALGQGLSVTTLFTTTRAAY